ncbi:MAG: cysteine peptidase family C39 domain-containing protein [Verrucomicrobiales bacterium]|nr:C39 family peptidase [Verrucomicrobiae bacterium]MCP5552485.1 C39 family peptidase [Akkermansiaceae bacterium]HRX54049.1 cysteine peptidase family C39 domain-containing protein [Verrucomicrobiales bacterium]
MRDHRGIPCLAFKGLFLVLALLSTGCLTGRVTSTSDKDFVSHFKGFRYCGVKAVKQSRQISCGAAALVSVMNYWQEDGAKPFSESDVWERFPPQSNQGYPILQLRDIAFDNHFTAFAVSMDKNPWQQLVAHLGEGRPVIVAVRLPRGPYFGKKLPLVETLDRRTLLSSGNEWKSHYVVVMGHTYQEVLLMDPQYGIVRVGRDEFLSFWKPEKYSALVCSPAEDS